jgi:hypothetical protein
MSDEQKKTDGSSRTKEFQKNWPQGVRPMSWDALGRLGVDDTNQIYWDGKRLKTEVKLGWFASIAAVVLALSTVVAAAATTLMAYTDWQRFLAGN